MTDIRYQVGDIIYELGKAVTCIFANETEAVFSDRIVYGLIDDSKKPREFVGGVEIERDFVIAEASEEDGWVEYTLRYDDESAPRWPVIGARNYTVDCCGNPTWDMQVIAEAYPDLYNTLMEKAKFVSFLTK